MRKRERRGVLLVVVVVVLLEEKRDAAAAVLTNLLATNLRIVVVPRFSASTFMLLILVPTYPVFYRFYSPTYSIPHSPVNS